MNRMFCSHSDLMVRCRRVGFIFFFVASCTFSFLASSRLFADLSFTSGVYIPASGIDAILARSLQRDGIVAAVTAFQNRNIAECERLLTQATDRDPSLPSVSILMARLFVQSGNVVESIARLEGHIAIAPRDPLSYIALSEIALKSGRWTDAWLLLQFAEQLITEQTDADPIARDELRATVYGLKGESAANRRQWVEAEELFSQYAKLRPTDATPVWSIGKLKLVQGDVEAALAKLREGRAIEPRLPQPELVIAHELAANLSSNDCEKWFLDGIKANDESVDNWIAYLRWLLARDRAADVDKLVPELKNEYRSNRDIKFLSALSCRFLGKISEAEKGFSEIHQAKPDDVEAADQLALVLIESNDEGKRARAQQLSEANLRRAPNVENTAATAAWVQFKLGSVDVADRMLAEITANIAISPQTAYYVAELLRSKGKEAEAKQVLETAVKSTGIFIQRAKVQSELSK